tara:strand:- start:1654 stop:2073 length:420 start_codon:yes stop_codon:yes gene_type:complete
MRSALILICVLCTYLPTNAQARSAINRCFEDYATNEARLFACMSDEYDQREKTRKFIEDDIVSFVNKHESAAYNSVRREKDTQSLIEGREMFEAYRKHECSRQKSFLERKGPQATYEYMVCLYDMTTQRIRTLQNSLKE